MNPTLQGIFAIKLPASDLDRSIGWYGRIFGFQVEIEFPDADGAIGGVAGHLDGVTDTYLALRRDPGLAQALAGANLVNFAVADRAEVESWIDRLDELDVPHSPLIDATIGWMTVLHDPDGLELHLYSRERHGIDHADTPGYGRAASATRPQGAFRDQRTPVAVMEGQQPTASITRGSPEDHQRKDRT